MASIRTGTAYHLSWSFPWHVSKRSIILYMSHFNCHFNKTIMFRITLYIKLNLFHKQI